jgi:hypothetical protein
VENDLILKGASGELLSLASSEEGARWIYDVQDAEAVSELAYLDVKDSYSLDTAENGILDPSNSTNSGHNWNWFASIVWSATAGTTDWSTAGFGWIFRSDKRR